MKKALLLIAALAGAPVTAHAADLNKAYTLSLGEVIASDLAMLLDAMRANDQFGGIPTTVQYDKKAAKIEIVLLGNKGSVDMAKRELEDFWKRYFDILSYRAELQYGVKLEDDDFRLKYLNRSAEYAEVIKRENGKMLLP